MELTQLIIYACPIGSLSKQIDAFFERSLYSVGRNRAHDYMPHCTLTGFFRDSLDAVPLYISAIEKAIFDATDALPPTIEVTGMPLLSEWVGLTLEAEELKRRMSRLAQIAESPSRPEALRLKSNLHLSLAYEFAPEEHSPLAAMATEMIHPKSDVDWEIRLYQRHPDNSWTCHYSRRLY